MNFQTTVLALAAAPTALAQYFPDQAPQPTRYGPYCAIAGQNPLAKLGGNGAATTLVIGDSYAEFSSSWGGDPTTEAVNPIASESYFTTYCGGGADNDNGLEKICNMGISGTTSATMDYRNARDNQWSWAYTNSTTQESLVSRAFDAAPNAKRVIYYISGNDFMYKSCAPTEPQVWGMIMQSLLLVVAEATKRGLSPSDVTMISYATPEASFKDSRALIPATMPNQYKPPTDDNNGDDQDFTSINVVTNHFITTYFPECNLQSPSDPACGHWEGRVVQSIQMENGKYHEFSEFGDHFGVRDYCRKNNCAGKKVLLKGGICPKAQLSDDPAIGNVMDNITNGIRKACESQAVNYVDGRKIIEMAEGKTNYEWSTTDSGDQAHGYHYDLIHVNYRGNCQVAQSTSKDFEPLKKEYQQQQDWDHSFEYAMEQSTQYKTPAGQQFTCARQLDCTKSANFNGGQWVIPGAGGTLPADNGSMSSSDDSNDESGLRL